MDITLERILSLLSEQHKTQKDLTDYLGITSNSFTNWKSGLNSSYKKYIYAISEFFNINVEYLKGESDEQYTKIPLPDSDEVLKFALYGGDDTEDITQEMLDDVKDYAKYIRERKRNNDT